MRQGVAGARAATARTFELLAEEDAPGTSEAVS